MAAAENPQRRRAPQRRLPVAGRPWLKADRQLTYRPSGILQGMTIATRKDDFVVLLDQLGNPCGTAPRASVHQRQTPLHLAFSCYITRPEGEVLVTRRAITKLTWPGVWTNSCCGHPQPGEDIESAVARRVREELGLALATITPVIPGFKYTAVDASGIMENEVCPVYLGIAAEGDDVAPDPLEVAEYQWVSWDALGAVATSAPWLLSPWASEQISILRK
jgi:isopentenyl-diphosphate delta-isomerase